MLSSISIQGLRHRGARHAHLIVTPLHNVKMNRIGRKLKHVWTHALLDVAVYRVNQRELPVMGHRYSPFFVQFPFPRQSMTPNGKSRLWLHLPDMLSHKCGSSRWGVFFFAISAAGWAWAHFLLSDHNP